MNSVTKEMILHFSGDPLVLEGVDDDIDIIDAFLMHYGVGPDNNPPGRGSGRYPEGSGDNAYQHAGDFVTRVKRARKEHPEMAPNDIAVMVGCRNSSDLKLQYSKALSVYRTGRNAQIAKMLESGMTQQAVADTFGVNESTLRSWLNPKSQERVNRAQTIADGLEKLVKERGLIDVGAGVEKELGCSKEKLKEALSLLEDKGYPIYGGRVPQATNPGKQTTIKALGDPNSEVKWSDLYQHPEKIQSVADYIVREGPNGEEVFEPKWKPPAAIDPKRIMIRYRDDVAPDGHTGVEKDGTIELRRNVPDLDLKGSHYAQVRILTQDQKYLKGMALYADYEMPEGIDVVFNTNKTRAQADIVFKPAKKDPNNPFGALLRNEGGQYTYVDKDGNTKLGLINKTRQEGDWEEWDDKLASQFLGKQPLELINKQLNKSIAAKKREYEELISLTNPTVKKKLLEDFANGCDSDSIHLSAAALPRQKYQVILPVPTLADDEVYAPNFHDGETIALIRYPHGGLFEIPILRVNNKNPQGRALIGDNPIDAIGLNHRNASILSGADFDGDTALCIPCNDPRYSDTKIQNQPPLKDLEGFEGKDIYGYDATYSTMEKYTDRDGNVKEKEVTHYIRNGKEFKPMKRTQLEMGKVSNLIMDMRTKGADDSDMAMAVKHSMVVIDAEKHHLDWQQSEKDNRILYLKKKYQEHYDNPEDIDEDNPHYGASTLFTRAKSPTRIDKPTGTPHIDPNTGELVYTEKQLKPQKYIGKDGKEHTRQIEVPLLSTKKSAFELVSVTNSKNPPKNMEDIFRTSPKEAAYALYSDQLRAMANEARKEILRTGDIKFNKSAKEQYAEEAKHLNDELLKSELNAPRERMAQYYARSVTLARKEENPDLTKKEIKKISNQALANGRIRYGAKRNVIDISPREWDAIQAGCIPHTNLKRLLNYANMDQVREYATPKQGVKLTAGQETRIKNMLSSGKTAAQIAEVMNISESTVNSYRKGGQT
jgi:DNA-binding CsgD family transcriptional regulator